VMRERRRGRCNNRIGRSDVRGFKHCLKKWCKVGCCERGKTVNKMEKGGGGGVCVCGWVGGWGWGVWSGSKDMGLYRENGARCIGL
jgi:hypothetical protein